MQNHQGLPSPLIWTIHPVASFGQVFREFTAVDEKEGIYKC